MLELNSHLAVAMLSASMAFTGVANAIQIPQYDKMALDDKVTYDGLLVVGAKNALLAHGQPEQAQKVIDLFKVGSVNGGSVQFVRNLEKIRLMNAKNAADPNNKQPPYEVEHAFYLTLKDNGITVPISVLLAINKDFKPSQPPVSAPSAK